MEFTVYILFSDTCRQFYIGQTRDLLNRIKEHNSGETPSIKKGMPWRLIWREELSTRSNAVKLERKIKARGARRFLLDRDIVWR